MFLLIYNFALAFAEKVDAQRGNLIPRGKHIAQVVAPINAPYSMAVTLAGSTSVPHKRPQPLNALLSNASKLLREPYVQQILLLGESIVGNCSGITVGHVDGNQIGHIVAYQCEVGFVHFSFNGQKVNVFGLKSGS